MKEKQELNIILTILNQPSQLAIDNLNKIYYNIIKDKNI